MAKKSSKSAQAEKSKKKQDTLKTFEYEGHVYTCRPSTEVFFEDMRQAGIITASAATRLKKAFLRENWTQFAAFENKTLEELNKVEGVSDTLADKIFNHKRIVSAEGKILKSFKDQVEENLSRTYLLTQVEELNFNLYDGNNLGFRSGTLIEFYGKPQMGKTQWMYDLAIRCMLPEEKGGWNRGVFYLDTEGAFSLMRLMEASRYWGLTEKDLNDKFFLIDPVILSSGTDLFSIVSNLDEQVKNKNAGMIIVDSLLQPFRSEFAAVTGNDLKRMAPRQSLIAKTLSKLKSMAKSYNLIVAYTNHVMANISSHGMGSPVVPLGGDTVGHLSDLRFYLTSSKTVSGFPTRKMVLKDCGWLPTFEVTYILSEIGVLSSTEESVKIVKNYRKSIENYEKGKSDAIYNHLGEKVSTDGYLLTLAEFRMKHPEIFGKSSKSKKTEVMESTVEEMEATA